MWQGGSLRSAGRAMLRRSPRCTIICGYKQLPLSGQLQVGKGLLVAVMEERA